MARGRKASATKRKLKMLVFGEQFTGKSVFALQIALMHNEDGSPMKVLYIDCESGSIDNYIESIEAQGVDMNNVYILYTSSLTEINNYIEKVKNREPLPELDDDGNEIIGEYVLDANGNPFIPDAIVVDGVTVIHSTTQQGLIEFSKKRARVRADNKKLVGEEKLVSIEGASIEQKDWGTIKFKGQSLILRLQGAGVHYIVTCRETDEKITEKDSDGKTISVPTGRKIPDGFKGLQYDVDTCIRLYRDEFDNVMASVEKDRTEVHSKEILENPSLLDWQQIIDRSKGKSEFIIKDDLVAAVQTEQELYAREVMGRALAPISEKEMEEELGSPESAEEIQVKIKDKIGKLTSAQKITMQNKLKEAGLPTAFNKVTDTSVLIKILNTISE